MDTPRLLKNRYRLGRVIGRGGMGVVWLATDEVLDRRVAVKEVAFPPGLSEEEQETLRRRTLREARTNARLNHPNVVGLYDIVEDEDRPWIVMEYVPSRSLAETVRADGPFTPERTAAIGLQLLGGLRAAHAAGVLHRDVKPSNVLLAEDGRVVLGDFGIATAKGGSTVTSSGVLIGSPSYMAPERARGHTAGPESDLWSLGGTLYTAVEGRPPFDRDSAVATLAALVMDDPDEPERAGPLWPLIRALLQRDPSARPTVETVAAGLREIAEGATDAAEAPHADPADAGADVDAAAPPTGEAGRVASDGSAEPATAATATALTTTAGTATAGTAAAGTGGTVPAGGDRSRRALVGMMVAAAVVAVTLLAWAAVGVFGGGNAHERRSANHAGTTPGQAPAGASSTGSPPTSPSATTASPTTSPTAAAPPDGYHWHHDRTGFSIAVPDGWSATHHGHYLYVEDPHSSRLLIVDQSDHPKSDPLADWKKQEAARRGGFSDYHRVRLESVDYPQARKAADWEFTYRGSSGRTHVLNRNILANSKHAYALYWQVPDSRWKASKPIFAAFATTFRPAKA
ncbi:serine/threonine protein kinase [Actinoallomurus sp. NBC_01490]|uniref:serine/threonine-protein kinase n=1 Tax=Actinoallomurus sp. NBC_01490 TaxID=2903557 RepID=UPI002E347323|nr:serine/threonine-protein kinase [Actinoallomurus sp. NBC_01490]